MIVIAIVAQSPTQFVPLQLFTVQRNPLGPITMPQMPGSIPQLNQPRPQILPPYSSYPYHPPQYHYGHHQHRVIII